MHFLLPQYKTKLTSTSKINVYEYQSSSFIHFYFLCILKTTTLLLMFPSLYPQAWREEWWGSIFPADNTRKTSKWLIPSQRQGGRFMSHTDKRWWNKLGCCTARPQKLPLSSRWNNHWNTHDSQQSFDFKWEIMLHQSKYFGQTFS